MSNIERSSNLPENPALQVLNALGLNRRYCTSISIDFNDHAAVVKAEYFLNNEGLASVLTILRTLKIAGPDEEYTD